VILPEQVPLSHNISRALASLETETTAGAWPLPPALSRPQPAAPLPARWDHARHLGEPQLRGAGTQRCLWEADGIFMYREEI